MCDILTRLTCEMMRAGISRGTIKAAAEKIRKISFTDLKCVKETLDTDRWTRDKFVEDYNRKKRMNDKLDMLYNLMC